MKILFDSETFDRLSLQNLKKIEEVINENDKREVLLLIINTLTGIEHKLNMKQLVRIFEIIKNEVENS